MLREAVDAWTSRPRLGAVALAVLVAALFDGTCAQAACPPAGAPVFSSTVGAPALALPPAGGGVTIETPASTRARYAVLPVSDGQRATLSFGFAVRGRGGQVLARFPASGIVLSDTRGRRFKVAARGRTAELAMSAGRNHNVAVALDSRRNVVTASIDGHRRRIGAPVAVERVVDVGDLDRAAGGPYVLTSISTGCTVAASRAPDPAGGARVVAPPAPLPVLAPPVLTSPSVPPVAPQPDPVDAQPDPAAAQPDPAAAQPDPAAQPADAGSSAASGSSTSPAPSQLSAPPTKYPGAFDPQGKLFAPDSIWNTRVDGDRAIDPNSDTMIASLLGEVQAEHAAQTGPWINTNSWSAPVYTVPRDQPTVTVHLRYVDPQLQAAFDSVPLPANARPAAGTDASIVIYQPSTDTMWEMWQLGQQLPSPVNVKASATSGGSLAAGTYSWVVTSTNAQGESTASKAASVAVSGGAARIVWTPIYGAVSYRIYRRAPSTASYGLVGTSTTASFTDDGSATAGSAPPASNTAATPGTWHASWGGKMANVSQSPGYYRNVVDSTGTTVEKASWGTTASSLPLVGGLITIRDLELGEIDHALQLNVPAPRSGVFAWPAQRTDGTSGDPSAIPEGAQLRLDPSLDLASLNLPAPTLAIARAAQKYGIVVNDKAGVIAFRAEDASPLMAAGQPNPYATLFSSGGKPLNAGGVLARFPWDHLQVLKMSLYTSGQTHS